MSPGLYRDYAARPCALPYGLASLVQICSRQICRTRECSHPLSPPHKKSPNKGLVKEVGQHKALPLLAVACGCGPSACNASLMQAYVCQLRPFPFIPSFSRQREIQCLVGGRDYSAHPCASPCGLPTVVKNRSRRFFRTKGSNQILSLRHIKKAPIRGLLRFVFQCVARFVQGLCGASMRLTLRARFARANLLQANLSNPRVFSPSLSAT